MSALTDLFTSLANKIRNKLGTTGTYTPAQAISAIDDVYTKGVTDTKKGNATAGDVKSGVTFTSANGVNQTGTFAAQEKTVTAGTSASSVTPDSGKYLSKVTVNPTPSQTKSATPSTSAQTISPDSGKLLSSVTVNAISPNRTTNSMIVPRWGDNSSTIPATHTATRNPRTDFGNSNTYGSAEMVEIAMPQGYYAWSYGNSSCCIPTETKTITSSRSAQTVTPTEYNTAGKYVKFLKSVTVNKYPDASGTYTPTANNTASDMGATNNYRYVNTSTVFDLGRKAGFYNMNTAFKRALSISTVIGDEIHLGARWFRRSAKNPAFIYSTYSADAGYVGYGMVTLSTSGFSGSYSTYGQFNTVKSRTANGITYYYAEMENKMSVNDHSLMDIDFYPYNASWANSGVPYIGYRENEASYLTTLDLIVTHVLSKISS